MRRLFDWLRGGRQYSDIRPPLRRDGTSPFTAGTSFLDADAAPVPRPAPPRAAMDLGLCPITDVAVVAAALAGPRSAAFGRCLPAGEDAFSGAGAPRELRLRALMALKTRVAAGRRGLAVAGDLPPWARGRLPAARRPLTRSPSPLPPSLAAVVDAATTPALPGDGPAFGIWEAPAIACQEA
jgi:hypothetical protein